MHKYYIIYSKRRLTCGKMEGCKIWPHSGKLLPEESNSNQVRLTVVSDRINYPGNCGTPTADMLTVKLLLSSVISNKGAKFM